MIQVLLKRMCIGIWYYNILCNKGTEWSKCFFFHNDISVYEVGPPHCKIVLKYLKFMQTIRMSRTSIINSTKKNVY